MRVGLIGLAAATLLGLRAVAEDAPPPRPGVPPEALAAEGARVAVVEAVRPAVLAVCFFGGEACGSGVVIDPEGYALTNYHVVEPTGPVLQCGMPDGLLYDAVVVGHDRVGDVALIKLLPREPGKPFPFVKLADSDKVRAGDWSLAMGNPFGLSLDFTPTVTFGLVSGVNRYQPPEGKGTLEYTDCIQTDASINPGNSGGPLFNLSGELIGINGRGSFEKRGRVNSGVGYAISINQIKNFLGQLHAGLDCDHASLGAIIEPQSDDGDLSRLVVRNIESDGDLARRGVQIGDQLTNFAGRAVSSVNHYKNVLGIYPKGWRVPITLRRGNEARETLVRLGGVLDPEPPPGENAPKRPAPAAPKRAGFAESPAHKLYEAKPGYANFHPNRQLQARLKAALRPDPGLGGPGRGWEWAGNLELADRRGEARVRFAEGADGQAEMTLSRGGIEDAMAPLKPGAPLGELLLPQGSGGLLAALYQYRRLVTLWDAGFEGQFAHGGVEPFYALPPPGSPATPAESRVDCEVLLTRHGSFESRWYFDRTTRQLVGCESRVGSDEEPCELTFADFAPQGGRDWPRTIRVRVGAKRYAELKLTGLQFGVKP